MKSIKHTLYLDDDPDDHQIFQAAVSEIDPSVNVQVEIDPIKALRYLQSSKPKPDLVLVDINMPKMTGFEFCEKLRSSNSIKDIPVILYSTSSEDRDLRKAKEIGAFGFSTKSFAFADLRDAITCLLGRAKLERVPLVRLFVNS